MPSMDFPLPDGLPYWLAAFVVEEQRETDTLQENGAEQAAAARLALLKKLVTAAATHLDAEIGIHEAARERGVCGEETIRRAVRDGRRALIKRSGALAWWIDSGGPGVVTFIALYRGSRLSSAELVAVSTDPSLVAHVAAALLATHEHEPEGSGDVATQALSAGRQHALELVRDEASSRGAPHGPTS